VADHRDRRAELAVDDTLNDILQVAPDATRDAVVVTDPPESSEDTALVPAAPLRSPSPIRTLKT
jgi:hypothetical protein